MTMSVLLLVFTVVLLAVGFPVGFALAGATLAAVGLGSDFPLVVVLKEMFVGVDSFALLAVPFFILAAEIMSGGADRGAAALRLAVRRPPARRAGLRERAVADDVLGHRGLGPGGRRRPGRNDGRMMEQAGYDRAYAAALTAPDGDHRPDHPAVDHHDHLRAAGRAR